MNIREQYTISQQRLNGAIEVILGAIVSYFIGNKKALLMLLLFELWIHSLMFQHLTELQDIWQLLPFVK